MIRYTLIIVFLSTYGLLNALHANSLTLENEFLKLLIPDKGEVLIEQIEYKPRELHNLRKADRNETSILSFLDDKEEQVGIKVSRFPGENQEKIQWKKVEFNDRQITLESLDQHWQVLIELPEKSLYAELTFRKIGDNVEDRLAVSFMLEVAGTFLGVPTEGPADYQIIPVKGESGNQGILTFPIFRERSDRFSPVSSWWAVGDRADHLVFACEVDPAILESVSYWSGLIQTKEALREEMILNVNSDLSEITLRVFLLDRIDSLSGLSATAAFWLKEGKQSEARELVVIPVTPLKDGELLLSLGSEDVAQRIQVENWISGKRYIYEIESGIKKDIPILLRVKNKDISDEVTLFPHFRTN